jgi:hypothetical protein
LGVSRGVCKGDSARAVARAQITAVHRARAAPTGPRRFAPIEGWQPPTPSRRRLVNPGAKATGLLQQELLGSPARPAERGAVGVYFTQLRLRRPLISLLGRVCAAQRPA